MEASAPSVALLSISDRLSRRQTVSRLQFVSGFTPGNQFHFSISHSTAALTLVAAAAKTLRRLVRFVRSSFVCQKLDGIEVRYERNDGATKRRKCWATALEQFRIKDQNSVKSRP